MKEYSNKIHMISIVTVALLVTCMCGAFTCRETMPSIESREFPVEFELDGNTFAVGKTTLYDFCANSDFYIEDSMFNELPPGLFTIVNLESDIHPNSHMNVTVNNSSEQTLNAEDCIIYNLTIYNDVGNEDVSAFRVDDISIDSVTISDVSNIYGNPSYENSSWLTPDTVESYCYSRKLDSGGTYEVTFYVDENESLIHKIELEII